MPKRITKLRLKELMESANYGVTDVVVETRLPAATVYDYMRGDRKSILFNHVDLLCDLFNCEPGDLFERVEVDEADEEGKTKAVA